MSSIPPMPPMPPMPVAPLGYSTPPPAGRPGLVTAIGIISIVMGCLSGLFSLSGVASALLFFAMARAPAPVLVPPPSTTGPAATAPATTAPTADSGNSHIIVHSTSFSYSVAGASTTASVRGNPQFSWISLTLSIAESVLSLLLAIFLLVIGIQVMRGSRKAVAQHWIYVAAKIPLIFVAAIAKWMMTLEMMRGISSNPAFAAAGSSGALSNWMILISVLITAGFALVYPVGLIFILSNRSVKEYARATAVG